jgi:hypothetical protein
VRADPTGIEVHTVATVPFLTIGDCRSVIRQATLALDGQQDPTLRVSATQTTARAVDGPSW